MGCDIHLHIEVKIKVAKQKAAWQHYAMPRVPRNYDLFARMAGVRNYNQIEPLVEPRGIPEDVTDLTMFDYIRGGDDWHTPSWLNDQEIAVLENWGMHHLHPSPENARWKRWDMNIEWGLYLFGNSFGGFFSFPEERPKGLEGLRFVFWYDN